MRSFIIRLLRVGLRTAHPCLPLFILLGLIFPALASAGIFVPKFAYVANSLSDNISVYTANPTTGALTAVTTVASVGTPTSVAVDPSGRFCYVTNRNMNNISVYTINQTTGALTAGTAVATSGYYAFSIVVDPTGRFAYVVNDSSGGVSVYTINQTTGALTAGTAVATGVGPSSVTVDPSGKFAYVANSGSGTVSVYAINQTTGALTAGTAVAAGNQPSSVTVDPTGKYVYVSNRGYGSDTVSIYTINQTTGALTTGTAVATGNQPLSVTVDPAGKFAYVANSGSQANNVSVYMINQTTGALTAGAKVAAGTTPSSVTVDPSGQFAYVANSGSNNVSVYTINQTTGALTAGIPVATGSGPVSVAIVGELAKVPTAPIMGAATAGTAQATVSFTAPINNGGRAISGYTVTSNPGGNTATGSASPISVTGLTTGTTYTFTVTATNDVGTSAASAASNSVTLIKASQTVSFGTTPSIVVGGTGTVPASATSGLTVSFSSSTPSVCTVNGSTVTGVSAGTCTLAADQAGDANYNAATQVLQTITVGKGSQTISFGAAPTVVAGGTGTVSATGGASGNAVTFSTTATNICTVSGSTVTGVTAGTCTIAANQLGDANYTAATQVMQSITIVNALNLTTGWNLLGNSSSAPIDVATGFGDPSKITTVWKWNKTASKWAFYAPSMTSTALSTYAQNKGYDVLTSIAPKEGFWVNASAVATLTGPAASGVMLAESDLQQGWNLVGSTDNKTPSQLNAGLSSSLNSARKLITTAWAWDALNKNWKFFAPSLEASGGLTNYITTKGYLPFSTAISATDGFWLNIGAASLPSAVPTVTGMSTSTGTAGSSVTITGTNFSTTPASNTVTFGGTAATVTAATATSLTVTVPSGATSGTVSVATAGGTATSAGSFTVNTGGTTGGSTGGTTGAPMPVAGLMGGAIQGNDLGLITTVVTFAGSGAIGTVNGTATAASFNLPAGITTDGTNLYVSEFKSRTIRKIVIATGAVSTLAVTGDASGLDGNINVVSAGPSGITTDGTSLYVTMSSKEIRKVVIATGVVTTLAGATSPFYNPSGITTDGINLYVVDRNNKIYQIVIATGAVTTLAGSGTAGAVDGIGTAASFNGPTGITTDGINLYIGDSYSRKIRKIVIATGAVTTLAGSGAAGAVDGIGTAASFNGVNGITTDGINLYMTDGASRIHKIVIATGAVTTLAGAGAIGQADGTGTAASFYGPTGIITDGNNLYVTDTANNRIRRIAVAGTPGGTIFTMTYQYAYDYMYNQFVSLNRFTPAYMDTYSRCYAGAIVAGSTGSVANAAGTAAVQAAGAFQNLYYISGQNYTDVRIANSPCDATAVTGGGTTSGTTGGGATTPIYELGVREVNPYTTSAYFDTACLQIPDANYWKSAFTSGAFYFGHSLYATLAGCQSAGQQYIASGGTMTGSLTTVVGGSSGGTTGGTTGSSGGAVNCSTAWTGDPADIQVSTLCMTACSYQQAGSTSAKDSTCTILGSSYGSSATNSCSTCSSVSTPSTTTTTTTTTTTANSICFAGTPATQDRTFYNLCSNRADGGCAQGSGNCTCNGPTLYGECPANFCRYSAAYSSMSACQSRL